jgi:catechol 2,3-dioxygenase-like lactoylglutathione lyase family enzyme
MLTDAAAVAFLPSRDLARSRRFFAEVLGLAVQDVTPYACVLRAGGTMLRVTKVDELHPQPFTVLGWQVPDLRVTVIQLTGAGVDFLRFPGMDQDDDGIWAAPGGDLVAWFKDPDLNVLSLTQFVLDEGRPLG